MVNDLLQAVRNVLPDSTVVYNPLPEDTATFKIFVPKGFLGEVFMLDTRRFGTPSGLIHGHIEAAVAELVAARG